MWPILLWLLLTLCFAAIVRHLVSIGFKTQSQNSATKNLNTSFKQALEENHFGEFESEIELASKIKGLKVQSQRFIPNIKPRFYFNLDNQTTRNDIENFLKSLPADFAANVPALKISIEDSKLKDIYFYKISELFQLGYKEQNTIYPLSIIGLSDLADKIFSESKEYRFQNVSVGCNAMKTLLYILLLLFLTTPLLAQKSRFAGECLNDSIAETFELKLKKSKVDSIISVLYDYDERWTISRRIIIWTHNGQSHIKIVEGCNGIIKDTTYLFNSISLWEYIRVTHFNDVTVPIKSGSGQPHDKFYHIAVHTPHKTFFIVVEDNERRSSAKYKTPESDTRIMLTNKIDSLLN